MGGGGINWGDDWKEGEPRQWQNRHKGLELTVLNACAKDWESYLTTAVSDWNQSPSLDLTLETTDVDPACSGVRGKMKVCNGDYGATPWVGVNEVILENG